MSTKNFAPLCMLLLTAHLGADTATIQECDFMPQCTCTNSMVTCVGTRMFSLKDVFDRPNRLMGDERVLNQIVVSRSGLLQIDWAPKNIVTLSLPKNSIYRIDSRALAESRETLSSLDLSDNALSDLPNFSDMKQLRWLNLQRNQFSEVPPSLRLTNITTLLLSGNYIRNVMADQFPGTLTTLHLESNQILSVEGHSFPAGIRLLNLGNNFIRVAPHNFHTSGSLQRLILSNNAIQHLPPHWRLPNTFENLDLSRGSLRELDGVSLGLSNETALYLKTLHLEFNFITSVSENILQGVHLRKLFLNSNRLMQLPDKLFDGAIATTLLVLDLSDNQFEVLPDCVSYLQSLSVLVLKGNQLAGFEYRGRTPRFTETLQMLDLAYNKLTEIPFVLSNISSLTRLNLQGNGIDSLSLLSRGRWGSKLQSLILSNNAIKTVSHRDFSKLLALKELKLSFNNVRYLDQSPFEASKGLQALEMTSSLANDIPMKRLSKILAPLKQLRSLQVDYDRVYGSDVLAANLINVDFDGNDLDAIPFIPSHSKVTRLSFSYNGIRNLRRGSFQNVSSLEQVILIGNPLREVETDSFDELSSLVSVTLSSNRIRSIRSRSFRNLPSLQRIHLDNNLLQDLNFDMFRAAGRRLLLNVSTNFIKNISAANEPVDTRIVDLSHNELTSLTVSFWDSTKGLVQLLASRNKISQLLPGKTAHEKLSLVDLSWNRLTADAISNLPLIAPFLEELYLRANNLESVASPENVALDRLRNWRLRILDVSMNSITSLTARDLPSALQMLNVSENPLRTLDTSKLSRKLVALDVSRTHLRLDSVSDLDQLQMLNLSSTSTNELSGEILPLSLLVLDAAECKLKSISLNSPMLIELNLRNASLPSRTTVNAPTLRSLDLTHNAIRNLTALLRAFSTDKLRILAAEHNAIDKISPELWKQTPFLHTLDISSNPVDALWAHSFRGLGHLTDLDMRNLSLVHLDSRLLKEVPCLSTLRISTYNEGIRSLRLQELLAESQLRRAMVEVGEPVLSYQLQWAFANRAKLRELHVTGAPLRLILPDAFQGLESVHELNLRITHTSIVELPPGLLRYLTDVRYLSLDLRFNQLQSISPTVLDSKRLLPAQRDTQLLLGGLRVDGNPWRCTCDLAWLASWLRRWIRETGRLQRFEASTALQLHQAVRRATCYLPNGRSIPIVEFSFEELQCATTGASTNSAYHVLPTLASCVSFLMLMFISTV